MLIDVVNSGFNFGVHSDEIAIANEFNAID